MSKKMIQKSYLYKFFALSVKMENFEKLFEQAKMSI